MEIKEFPWYQSLEGIDYANWGVWLICGVIGVIVIILVASAISWALDLFGR